jgi:hypothetical protein
MRLMKRRMKQIVETTAGWVELEFRANPGGKLAKRVGIVGGYGVLVTPFDSDGWSTADEVGWLSEAPKDQQSLGEFLANVISVPLDEAESLAAESVAEWQDRSGRPTA